ncbi:hypothetical protein CONLIGDRAFT_700375 [Coniochaeta ligniaria NRRL 30616]|uniref:Uncharacterized protein n=1 Tax=Coniochaeta ligniaria NRRL 30616 TaxID=1408157 RepID=A0A1J7ISY7_9PEZI|nr:hypothetical protein CONLIGDRAFT_700375 [Coniochaeta ligniaria NRRL 30616]
MVQQTVLDVLLEPNPWLDASSVAAVVVESLFRQQLSIPWKKPPIIDQGTAYDHEIRDEKTLDIFLSKFLVPVVNGALAHVSDVLKLKEVFYLAPGSWGLTNGPPDWGLVSRHRMSEDRYYNLLPGDTKLHAKWRPNMAQSANVKEHYQWTLPVSQVGTYAAESEVRYSFIISDGHFVALRYSTETSGQGTAAGRPRRDLFDPSHQRVASDGTDISSIMGAMSIDSFGAQSYSDNNAANWEFLPPEYAVASWRAKGRGNWTVKLALFCLCCLAAGDDVRIGRSYPPLDSWRQEGPRRFVHNTTGVEVKKLPKDANLVDEESLDQDQSAGGYASGAEEGGNDENEEMEHRQHQREHSEGLEGSLEGKGRDEEYLPEEQQLEHQLQFDTSQWSQPEIYRDELEERNEILQGGDSGVSPSTQKKRIYVNVVRKNHQYLFADRKGQQTSSEKSDWTRVLGGWEYQGKKHAYFTAKLP